MKNKDLYVAYLRQWVNQSHESESPAMDRALFDSLPYQLKCFLAAAKIEILVDFGFAHVLSDYVSGGVYSVPEVCLDHYRNYDHSGKCRQHLSWDDIYLLGVMCPESVINNQAFYMVFPFEYKLILINEPQAESVSSQA
jgi:hypothetical protein